MPPKMKTKANRLLGWAKLKAEWAAAPSAEEVNAADEARLLADPAWEAPVPEEAADFVANLVATYSAEQLATAFVNLYRARASAPEELADPGSKDDSKRPAFGPSVWFSVSQGRNDGAEPRTLLPMLCRAGDLTKDDIGAIRVQASHSFVEILASSAPKFLNALGPDRTAEEGAVVTQLDKAPDLPKGGPASRAPRGPKPGGPKPQRKPAYDPDAPSHSREPRTPAMQRPWQRHARKSPNSTNRSLTNQGATNQGLTNQRPTGRNSTSPKRPRANARQSRTRQNAAR
ncbi:DbpA RNA binding domain-containing protein [Sulfitobacter porphyrae]|uniref:DbpA RNA binding domain-containing protein n=1 Tax=Sulfitobacter porphyrae TaxID=1246864 RepID=A0ABW2B186_9RHOB